jgi:biotin carboxylase
MAVASIEALTFGLGRLVQAAEARNEAFYLLSRDKSRYHYELSNIASTNFKVVEVDTFDRAAVLRALRGVPELRGLINQTDRWSLVSLAVASELGLPSQDPESVRLVRDKHRLRNFLYERGLSSANAYMLEPVAGRTTKIAAGLRYPAIVKDSSGTGSENVWLAEDENELSGILSCAQNLPLNGKLLAEPYFSGVLYSVETLSWDGEIWFMGVSSRILSYEPHFREEATSFPVQLPLELKEHLYGWVERVFESIGYTRGFAHTEFIHTSEGFEIVEINPRLGGVQVGEAICRAYDINVYEAFIDMALNQPPSFCNAMVAPSLGVGQVVVHARETGRFQEVRGLNKLAQHPGEPEFYPTVQPGSCIPSLIDHRGCVGILFATGPTSELALQNALAASRKLQVVLD